MKWAKNRYNGPCCQENPSLAQINRVVQLHAELGFKSRAEVPVLA